LACTARSITALNATRLRRFIGMLLEKVFP
jgi:hypothetical protein